MMTRKKLAYVQENATFFRNILRLELVKSIDRMIVLLKLPPHFPQVHPYILTPAQFPISFLSLTKIPHVVKFLLSEYSWVRCHPLELSHIFREK